MRTISAFFRFADRLMRRSERRLHKRAIAYWQSLAIDGDTPRQEHFDFSSDPEFSAKGFLLDFRGSSPFFLHVGDILQDEANIASHQVALADVSETSLVGQFARRYPDILENRQPAISEYTIDTDVGYRVYCRGALLPLRSIGEAVDCVYGVVSWKSELKSAHREAPQASSAHE